MASTWISYNDLAWTEKVLAKPDAYKNEVLFYVALIKKYFSVLPISMLHLGCGAGGHDAFFKQHFTITGVDLSEGMLKIARKRHPEIEYIEGDMKSIRLNRQFDIVIIPDSIDYMVSEEELQQAISTAVLHLKTGGILLIAAKTEETIQNNNFAYSGEENDINVTVLENNYINTFKHNIYEVTLMYLIRKQGELSIYTENQILGLFSQAKWEYLLINAGLEIQRITLTDVYNNYILNNGEYPITIFIGKKWKHD